MMDNSDQPVQYWLRFSFFFFSFPRDPELNLGCAAFFSLLSAELVSLWWMEPAHQEEKGSFVSWVKPHIGSQDPRRLGGACRVAGNVWLKTTWLGLSWRFVLSDAEGKKNRKRDKRDCWLMEQLLSSVSFCPSRTKSSFKATLEAGIHPRERWKQWKAIKAVSDDVLESCDANATPRFHIEKQTMRLALAPSVFPSTLPAGKARIRWIHPEIPAVNINIAMVVTSILVSGYLSWKRYF